MGYVGLTLGLVLAEEGFQVTGVDVDGRKVEALAAGTSHVHELGLPELLREQLEHNFFVACEMPEGGDVFVIAVGTPVRRGEDGTATPDVEILREAVEKVRATLAEIGFGRVEEIESPILGVEGNKEFLLYASQRAPLS